VRRADGLDKLVALVRHNDFQSCALPTERYLAALRSRKPDLSVLATVSIETMTRISAGTVQLTPSITRTSSESTIGGCPRIDRMIRKRSEPAAL
jgi:hypothetical protein